MNPSRSVSAAGGPSTASTLTPAPGRVDAPGTVNGREGRQQRACPPAGQPRRGCNSRSVHPHPLTVRAITVASSW